MFMIKKTTFSALRKRRSCRRNSRRGFTLLEVLIASVLVAVIISGAINYLTYTGKIVNRQRQTRAATALAARRLELVMATSFETLESYATSVGAAIDDTFYLVYDNDRNVFDPSASKAVEVMADLDAEVIVKLHFSKTITNGSFIQAKYLMIIVEVYSDDKSPPVVLMNYHNNM